MPWMTIARITLSILITAVGKIPAEKWSALGGLVINFLKKMQDNLPAGHPLITTLNAYKAPYSLLAHPNLDDEKWAK